VDAFEHVGFPPCGWVRTTAPYATLRPYFSALAKKLIAGLRRKRVG
jgi:hypothetical protein